MWVNKPGSWKLCPGGVQISAKKKKSLLVFLLVYCSKSVIPSIKIFKKVALHSSCVGKTVGSCVQCGKY